MLFRKSLEHCPPGCCLNIHTEFKGSHTYLCPVALRRCILVSHPSLRHRRMYILITNNKSNGHYHWMKFRQRKQAGGPKGAFRLDQLFGWYGLLILSKKLTDAMSWLSFHGLFFYQPSSVREWNLAFLLAVHRLCGAIEGRLSHFLPRWLRTGWQSVISQGKIPWNTPPWLGIEPGPQEGQTVSYSTELSWHLHYN